MSLLFIYFFIDFPNLIEMLGFISPKSRGIELSNNWGLVGAQAGLFSSLKVIQTQVPSISLGPFYK